MLEGRLAGVDHLQVKYEATRERMPDNSKENKTSTDGTVL